MIQHPSMRLGRSRIGNVLPTLPIESFADDVVNDPTIAWSGTPDVGELLVAINMSRLGAAPTHTTPSGWTILVEATSSNCRATVYTRVAGASEPTSFQLVSSASLLQSYYAARFPVGASVDASGSNTASTGLTLKVSSSPITVAAGAFAVAGVIMSGNQRTDFAFDSPLSTFEQLYDPGAGNYESCIASGNYTSGGTVDPEFSTSSGTSNLCSVIVSIK